MIRKSPQERHDEIVELTKEKRKSNKDKEFISLSSLNINIPKMDTEIIVRRKAKRIQRARDLMFYLKSDIKRSTISENEKEWISKDIDEILEYLKNDDYEENKYNFDNRNG